MRWSSLSYYLDGKASRLCNHEAFSNMIFETLYTKGNQSNLFHSW